MSQAAVIINPSKPVDVNHVRTLVEDHSRRAGWRAPLWFETTPEEPGTTQAEKAVAAGVDVVIVGGGDGTVRYAARGLTHSGIPMVLLPLGTGNLLARNLDVPRNHIENNIAAAFTGVDSAIDVGWLELHRPSDPEMTGDHIFLVLSSLGFGGDIMAHTDEKLKKRLGWLAYFVAGAKNWRGKRIRVLLAVDDHPPVRRRQRTVLVGNCGRIMGGLTLLPDAIIDDGWLDVSIMDPRGGIFGWSRMFGEVVRQGMPKTRFTPRSRTIENTRCRSVTIVSPTLQQAQVDGDPIGAAQGLTARVDPGALLLRTPSPSPSRRQRTQLGLKHD